MAHTRINDETHSLEQLRQWLPKGTRVFTVLRAVSQSGMRREVSVVLWQPGAEHPIHHVCQVLGLRRGRSDCVVIQGYGMDMGFDLVYELAYALYGNSDALT